MSETSETPARRLLREVAGLSEVTCSDRLFRLESERRIAEIERIAPEYLRLDPGDPANRRRITLIPRTHPAPPPPPEGKIASLRDATERIIGHAEAAQRAIGEVTAEAMNRAMPASAGGLLWSVELGRLLHDARRLGESARRDIENPWALLATFPERLLALSGPLMRIRQDLEIVVSQGLLDPPADDEPGGKVEPEAALLDALRACADETTRSKVRGLARWAEKCDRNSSPGAAAVYRAARQQWLPDPTLDRLSRLARDAEARLAEDAAAVEVVRAVLAPSATEGIDPAAWIRAKLGLVAAHVEDLQHPGTPAGVVAQRAAEVVDTLDRLAPLADAIRSRPAPSTEAGADGSTDGGEGEAFVPDDVAADIIKAMSNTPRRMLQTDIVSKAGYSRGAVRKRLNSMQEAGWIKRHGERSGYTLAAPARDWRNRSG